MTLPGRSLWNSMTKSSIRLPLACMVAVPSVLLVGYGMNLPAEAWATPKPMLLGFMLVGMLMMIAGAYLWAEAAAAKD